MKIKIRRIDKSLPLPEYKTKGAAAMDCLSREDITIQPGKLARVPLNIALQLPKGHFTHLVARSSLHKRGLMLANGAGILDEDYSGNDDEYRAPIYNFGDQEATIQKGDRIVQIVVLPYDRVEWKEVESLNNPNRGAFGTTGNE